MGWGALAVVGGVGGWAGRMRRLALLLAAQGATAAAPCTDPTYSTCYASFQQISYALSTADPTKPLAAGDVVHFNVSYLLGGKANSVPSQQTSFVASLWFGAEVVAQPPGCTVTAFQGLLCALGPTGVNETVTLLFAAKVPEGALAPHTAPFSYQIWDQKSDVPPGQPHEWGDTRTDGSVRLGFLWDSRPRPPPPKHTHTPAHPC